jgi:two-component system sensor histidine kinase PilS (NtrC family)
MVEGQESWFGGRPDWVRGTGASPSSGSRSTETDGLFALDSALDSAFGARREPRGGDALPAFERIYQTFLGARAVLSLVLCASLGVAGVFATVPGLGVLLVTGAYTLACFAVWIRPPKMAKARHLPGLQASMRGLSRVQWWACVGVDILSLTALHVLSPSASLNYLAFLLLPVLMAGALTSRTMALATAALTSLIVLGVTGFRGLESGEFTGPMTQAGLSGCGFFLAVLLVSELALRLAREELSAKDSMELARQQAQLNRLVIEEMNEGLMVVDRRDRVRAANPAARMLLVAQGMSSAPPFQLRGVVAWQPLVATVERAFVEGGWPEAGRDVIVRFEGAEARTLRVRVRFTRRADVQLSEELCVLLIEDVRSLQARTRQEKLAAMGRVSAGIAHEIRNPLSAILQANALLAEDELSAAQRRLANMVNDNVQRIKRIVDDVMELASSPRPAADLMDIGALTATICSEWLQAQGLSAGSAGVLECPEPRSPSAGLWAHFEPDHLRRVLVNLLDNAYRHCNRAPGAIRVQVGVDLGAAPHPAGLGTGPAAGRIQIIVGSNGEPIGPEVERHLFEPFFSTRSRGTGLGLFICRELCERHKANIEYRLLSPGERNRNEFIVSMPHPGGVAATGLQQSLL